jgi:predicted nuclease with TOPRIM domain
MTKDQLNQIIQRRDALKKELNAADTEVTIRKRQLKELAPQRKAIEQECLEKFECEIGSLADKLSELSEKAAQNITTLESKLAEAKNPKTQED